MFIKRKIMISKILISISFYFVMIHYGISITNAESIRDKNSIKNIKKSFNAQSISGKTDSSRVLVSIQEMIVSNKEARLKIFKRVLIVKKTDEKLNHIIEYNSSFIKTKKIEGRLLSIDGKEIKKIKKRDIKKYKGSRYTLVFSDGTAKAVSITHSEFPYILELYIENEYKSLFFWPDWNPQTEFPVRQAIYRLTRPLDFRYNSHKIGIKENPSVKTNNGKIIETWSLNSLPPRSKEKYAPPEAYRQFAINFSAEKFALDKYKAECTDWNSFGSFYNDLARGRYNIPAELAGKIRILVNEATDKKDIISKLYNFLQHNTRYVLKAIRISGWQPEPAASVYKNKFGDCKGLSTLMVGMLNNAGIKAYPALTLTRNEGVIIPEFPSSQFNHCIAVVPMEKDTVWLECTSNLTSAGELPAADEGVYALVIDENGSNLIKTPVSTYEDNIIKTNLKGTLNSFGNLNFSLEMSLSGNSKIEMRNRLFYTKHEKIDIELLNLLNKHFSGITIESYNVENLDNNLHKDLKININGTIKKFSQTIPKRLIFNPNIIHRFSPKRATSEKERILPVYYEYPFTHIDSVYIEFSKNYTFEGGPGEKEITTDFACYKTTVKSEKNYFSFARKTAIKKKIIAPVVFNAYNNFQKEAVKNDYSNFSLIKKK
ncbi:transglutaminase domain-containing protein [bacterium]|nr:transglutaminase domain-containing protein [bacterium]